MTKTILQRSWYGHDGWGSYKERVTINENNELDYSITEGGNCEWGEWTQGQGEKKALDFIFGELPLSETLILEFKKVCQAAPKLEEEEFNMDNY